MVMFHTLADMVIVVRMIVTDYGEALGLSQLEIRHLSFGRKNKVVVNIGKGQRVVVLVEV